MKFPLRFSFDSDISERLCMDISSDKRRTVLRNLSSFEVKTMADSETRLQVDCPHLDRELIHYATNRRAK
jgi:hypothetical protein